MVQAQPRNAGNEGRDFEGHSLKLAALDAVEERVARSDKERKGRLNHRKVKLAQQGSPGAPRGRREPSDPGDRAPREGGRDVQITGE